MAGPHRTHRRRRRRPGGLGCVELSENLGLRRGLGRIFGSSEGRAVYAAGMEAFILEA